MKKPRREAEATMACVSAGASPRHAMNQNLLRPDRLGLDQHKLPHRSLIDKLDAPGDLGEKRVVFAASHVQPRLDPRPALPDDNRPPRHQLPAESLESQPLRVRVAPVS